MHMYCKYSINIPYSGLFSRGAYFAKFEIAAIEELIFAKIMENYTHVPS